MRKKILRIILLIVLVIGLVIGGFRIYSFIQSKNLKNNNNYKLFRVKILVMEKNKKNYSFVDALPDHLDNLLNFADMYVSLKKEGNYYTFNMKDKANKTVYDAIVDYGFAKNNFFGEVINDCTYDIKTGVVKIPAKYYSGKVEEEDGVPLQLEVMARMSEKELKKISIDTTYKNIFTKKKNYIRNGESDTFEVQIAKGLKEKNIVLMANDTEVLSSNYSYDSKTGNLEISLNPIMINNLTIRYNNSIKKVLSITTATAVVGKNKADVIHNPTPFSIAALNKKPKKYSTPKVVKMQVQYWDKVVAGKTEYNVYNFGLHANSGFNFTSLKLDDFSDRKAASAVVKTSASKFGYTKAGSTPSDIYLVADCAHITTNAANISSAAGWHNYNWKYRIINVKDKKGVVTISIALMLNENDVDKDKGHIYSNTGTSGVYQTLLTLVKFQYKKVSSGTITATKNIIGSSEAKSGFKFRLYEDDKCTEESNYDDEVTDANGNVSWEKVDFGTYYIGEVETDATKWTDNTKCKKVTLSTSSPKVSNVYTANAGTYDNIRNYYVAKAYKKSNDSSCPGFVNGAKFKLNGTYEATTGGTPIIVDTTYYGGSCNAENGMAIYAMLNTNSGWSVTETSPNQYDASVYCSNGTIRSLKMWNSGSGAVSLGAATKMTYSNGKYYCPTGYSGTNALGEKGNDAVYYCLKVMKIDDSTGKRIKDANGNYLEAKFKITGAVNQEKTTTNGVATFLVDKNPGTYTVQETQAPDGYGLSSTQVQIDAVAMTAGASATDASKCSVGSDEAIEASTSKSGSGWVKFDDSKLVLNWYKVSRKNNSEMLNGAKFAVKNSSGKYVQVNSNKDWVKTKDGTQKLCYIANGYADTKVELESYNTQTKVSGSTTSATTNGEVCIGGVVKGSYTIEEVSPAQYHTFGSKISISQSAAENYYSKVVNSQTSAQETAFINCETEFELTKKVDNDHSTDANSEQYKKTTKELQKLKFNIYACAKGTAVGDCTASTGTLIKFTGENGAYEYANGLSNLSRNSSGNVTDLVLNEERKFNIKYLPWEYVYKLVEKSTTDCKDLNGNQCESQGFYLIKDSDSPGWTINTKSSSCPSDGSKVTRDVTNDVTEINFTKKDIYSYFDGNTNSEVESKYENDQEYKLFDTIDFVLKDGQGRRVKLEKIKDAGVCNLNSANNKTAYAEYRYVLDDGTTNTTEVIHTYCGNIKIKHLCRDSEYTIEEISVPNESVFILPEQHPEVKFTTGSTKDSFSKDSETHIIENIPTRVVFQKRDLKYGNIISEPVGQEKTTFEVYRCNEGVELKDCTPTTSTLIKFHQREVIKDYNDNEDYGKEVYRYPEKQTESDLVDKLHPYKGDLILRYLPNGEYKTKSDGTKEYVVYNYILYETQAPEGYDTPNGGREITSFRVNGSTVGVEVVNIPNKPTKLILKKYDIATNQLITGAKFRVWRVKDKNYDQHKSLKNQDKEEIKLKTIRDGEYEYRDNKDTYVITTCIKDCNLITSDLVATDFENTGMGQDELTTEIKEGEALIQYLEADNYYIIEEVDPKDGYTLPNDEDRYTLIYIGPQGVGEAIVELYNYETVYQFYKFDEYNQLIDGAEFKLQKLDDNKKYHDVNVVLDEERTSQTENAIVYKVSEDTDNTTIITKNGSAMIYRLTEGQYRILEVKAPEGKELPKKTINVATFFVDKNGSVYGSSIITNKAPTEQRIYMPSANAEFIVDIKTGQNRIKYGLIIATIIIAVSALIYFQNKKE